MAISVVQHGQASSGTSISSLQANISATAAGSVLVVIGMFDAGAGVTSITVTDSAGDTYTADVGPTVAIQNTNAKYFSGHFVATTGTTFAKVTYNGGTPGFGDFVVWEVAGIPTPTPDKFQVDNGTGAVPGTHTTGTATGTLAAANEACFCYALCSGAFAAVTAGNGGWTHATDITNTGGAFEDQVVSSNASITGEFISGGTAGNWDEYTFTFRDATEAKTPIERESHPPPRDVKDYYPIGNLTTIATPPKPGVVPRPQLMGQMVM
jgi:hypothetical protein